MYKKAAHFRIQQYILLIVLLGGVFLPPAKAAFKSPGFGARPEGLGGAFVALSDDTNSILFNPAGSVQSKQGQVSFMHSKLFIGLGEDINFNLNSFFTIFPVAQNNIFIETVGFGWTNLRAPNYREDTVYLLGAYRLNQFFYSMNPEISVGFNIKYLRTRFDLDARTQQDPVFREKSGNSAMSFDLGVWGRPDPFKLPGLQMGAVIRNVNEPDIGLLVEDKVKSEISAGVAYKFSRFLVSSDFIRRGDEGTLHSGVETWFLRDQFLLRMGGNADEISAGGTTHFKFGEKLSFMMDYAFSFPFNINDVDGSHRVSVRMGF